MLRILEDNTSVNIGEDCMFSTNINIWASDTHTITDLDGKIQNIGKFINIGNHVWFGDGVTVCKNTTIKDNTIVGTKAVVSGNIKTSNCVLAGNPAKVVKENVTWNRERPNLYKH